MKIKWQLLFFDALSPAELYAVMRLRSEVFVVEQNCVYLDADDKDPQCWHLMGWQGEKLVAYCRLLPPGLSYPSASIGRVITAPEFRRTGAGRELMRRALAEVERLYHTRDITIGAQLYLKRFYESLGFRQSGDEYLEDNIPHIPMEYKGL
jgi:ElaA protein